MDGTYTALVALRRPRILIGAARFGVAQYDRKAVLRRIFGEAIPVPGELSLRRLLEYEAAMDAARKNALGSYAIADHIDALAAIMAESRLLHERGVIDGDARTGVGRDAIPFGRRAQAVC